MSVARRVPDMAGVAIVAALVMFLLAPGAAIAYPMPAEDTTATPVVGSVEATIVAPVTLSDETIVALAEAISSNTATVTVPGTITVDPWRSANLPEDWQVYLVAGLLGALGVVAARALR